MNSHYIPRLLLRQFAEKDKVNTYDFSTNTVSTKKLKNTFMEKDIFDEELEQSFAKRLEGPFADLLNHKLLHGETISLNRRENLLLRKFMLINFLRAPIVNGSWETMVQRTKLKDHPSVQAHDFLCRHHPEYKEMMEKSMPSDKTYLSDLKKAMEIGSLEELANPANNSVSDTLRLAATQAMVTTMAFWDCTEAEQEFILPKLPGISQMDQVSIFYKGLVLKELQERKGQEGKKVPFIVQRELERLMHGNLFYMENFSIHPLSPTRALICFSPYFRAFFPMMDEWERQEVHPPLLSEEQFQRHFFKKTRMELFRPCKTIRNQYYFYDVKHLTVEEVMELNSQLLDMETEEFVFHDFNKLRDAFWYYDHKVKLALEKKHDFSNLE